MRRWTKIGAGVAASVTTILGLFFLLQSNFGFIITDQTGNFSCEGSYENPCISEFSVRNPTRYDVDIFNQDEIQLDFSPNIEDYALFTKDGRCSATGSCACTLKNGQRIGFKGWRCIDFTEDTKPIQDKVYVFRFPRYSTKEFRLVEIKKNPNDVVKWGFGANDEYLDPVWDAKIKSIRTPTTETISNQDGTKTLTLYSGIRFVEEDSTWKKIEEAKSLKNSGIKCIVKKDSKDDPDVECLDYNYTSIKIDIKDGESHQIKIFSKNISEKDLSKNMVLEESLSEKGIGVEIIKIDLGKELHIGANSTIVILQDADSENLNDGWVYSETPDSVMNSGTDDEVLLCAHEYYDESYSSYLSFNISSLAGTTILNATLSLETTSIDGSGNINLHNLYNGWINSTGTNTLDENDLTWNNQPCGNSLDNYTNCNTTPEDTITTSSIGTIYNFTVTNTSFQYVIDNSKNDIGFWLNSTSHFYSEFASKEHPTAEGPKLTVTYISAPVGNTCNYDGSGNWDIDCSDNCFINSSISINGNLSLLGSGTVKINSTLDFNSTGQIIYQGSGCSFVVNSGGKIS